MHNHMCINYWSLLFLSSTLTTSLNDTSLCLCWPSCIGIHIFASVVADTLVFLNCCLSTHKHTLQSVFAPYPTWWLPLPDLIVSCRLSLVLTTPWAMLWLTGSSSLGQLKLLNLCAVIFSPISVAGWPLAFAVTQHLLTIYGGSS